MDRADPYDRSCQSTEVPAERIPFTSQNVIPMPCKTGSVAITGALRNFKPTSGRQQGLEVKKQPNWLRGARVTTLVGKLQPMCQIRPLRVFVMFTSLL